MTEPFTLPPEIEAAKLAFGNALGDWAHAAPNDRKHLTALVNESELKLDAAILSALRQMGETREPTPEQEKAAFFAIHGYAPRWGDTGAAEGPELHAEDEERMAVICDVLRYRAAPVAEPPKPPEEHPSVVGLPEDVADGAYATMRALVPPVSALPTQLEDWKLAAGNLRRKLDALRDFGHVTAYGFREIDRELGIIEGAALSRPPREPSERITAAGYLSLIANDIERGLYNAKPPTFTPNPASPTYEAERLAWVRCVGCIVAGLRTTAAAYTAIVVATPPPGGTP